MGGVVSAVIGLATSVGFTAMFPELGFLGAFGSKLIGGVLGMATSLVAGSLLGTGAKPKSGDLGTTATDRKITLRSSIESRKLIYGTAMVSGPLALKATTGSTKEYLHLAVPVAARKVAAIREVNFDGTLATAARISAFNRVNVHLGSIRQQADSDLVAEVPGWTQAHHGRGIAYIYPRLKYSSDAWPNGIKNVQAVVQGHALYDPRLSAVDISSTDAGSPAVIHTSAPHGLAPDDEIFILGHDDLAKFYVVDTVPTSSSMTLVDVVSGEPIVLASSSTGGSLSRLRWSNNFALCVLDYMLWTDGLNSHLAEINVDYWIAAANASDEQVLLGATSACTAAPATDILTLAEAVPWQTGLQVGLTSTGTLPGGVAAGTSYAWIRLSPTTGKLAATKEDALYGLGVDITSAGTGVHTVSAALGCTLDTTANSVTLADNVPRDDTPGDDADQDEISPQFGWDTGDGVQFCQGTAPVGLALHTTYYWIRITNASGQLAATHDAAIAGTALTLADAGSGLTMARVSQPRYTVNGQLDLGNKPIDNVDKLLSAGGGMLPYVQGQYRLHPAVSVLPSFDLDESDLRANIKIQPRPAKRDVFNAVRGTYVDPTQLWQPTDLVPQVSQQYQDEDGGEQIWKDVEQPFTTDAIRGQRNLKIILECGRQGMIVDIPAKLTASNGAAKKSTMDIAPMDVGRLHFANLGWSGKLFICHSWKLADDFGVDLTLQEFAPEALDWHPSNAAHADYAPNTNLANPWNVAAPTALALESGTDVLAIRGDGTVQTRLKATWTAPADAFVLSGGRIEVQLKKSSDSAWIAAASVAGADTAVYLLDVEDGVAYDLRLRAVNGMGATSAWLAVAGHVVQGKSAPPSDITSFSVQQNGDVCTFQYGAVSDQDLGGYEMRFAAQDPSGNIDWERATVITRLTRGTLITNAALPPGPWTVGIKAVDTSGNYSLNAKTYNITVTTTSSIIASQVQHPNWPGVKSGMVLHQLTGRLMPESIHLASELGWEVFDYFVYEPQPGCHYETPEQDATFDQPRVRVWADMMGSAGPGETVAPGMNLELAQRPSGGSYGEFAPWTAGTISERYFKARAVPDLSAGTGTLDGMVLTADAEPFTQQGIAVVPAGGLAVTFPKAHHVAPTPKLTPSGSSALIPRYTNLTATGMTIYMANTSGVDVGGTCAWETTGP